MHNPRLTSCKSAVRILGRGFCQCTHPQCEDLACCTILPLQLFLMYKLHKKKEAGSSTFTHFRLLITPNGYYSAQAVPNYIPKRVLFGLQDKSLGLLCNSRCPRRLGTTYLINTTCVHIKIRFWHDGVTDWWSFPAVDKPSNFSAKTRRMRAEEWTALIQDYCTT